MKGCPHGTIGPRKAIDFAGVEQSDARLQGLQIGDLLMEVRFQCIRRHDHDMQQAARVRWFHRHDIEPMLPVFS
eukprot:3087471-Rhodomonas_salina.1